MKHNGHKKKRLLFRPQKSVIEFADLFHLAFPFLIILEPALHQRPLFGTKAELAVSTARIGDGQHQDPVAFATLATRATFLVVDRSFQQRTPQHLIGSGQASHQFAPSLQYFLLLHLSR